MAGILLAGSAAAAAVADEPWREIPYASIHGALSRFELGETKYLRVEHRFTVPPDALATGKLRVVIMAADGPIELELADDGRTTFPLTDALRAENPAVRTNAPPGQLSATIAFVSEIPAQLRFPYALLLEVVAEYDAVIARQGFLARMAAPKATGLRVEFEPGSPAQARIRARAIEMLAADEHGVLLIPLRRDWRRARPEVELSRMPLRMTLAL